jgi:hypothetical protein
MSAKRPKTIFQVKMSLREIEPPIWRSVQLAEDTKLPRLHRLLQLLFNWEDYHLHDVICGRRVYSVPDPDDAFNERKVSDERLVPLNRMVGRVGDGFEYVYDFGDDWRHEILLEAILLPSPDVFNPGVSPARAMGRPRMRVAPAATPTTCKRSRTRSMRNTRTCWLGVGSSIPRPSRSTPSTRL